MNPKFFLILCATLVLIALTGCTPAGQAIQLDADEKGAACLRGDAQSANPFIKGGTDGAMVEINTGDDSPVTPEQIAAIADALGCSR